MKKQLYPQHCAEQDKLYYNLMRSREFNPPKVAYWQYCINEHEKECPRCRKNSNLEG